MSTLKKEFEQSKIDYMKRYEKQWFRGNDGYYYYLDHDTSFFKCDGSKITNKFNFTIDDILSFEYMEESEFRDELGAILAKAYLTGIYIKKYRMFRGPYTINIME